MNASAPAGTVLPGFVDVDWNGRTWRIEHRWIAPDRDGPLLVFLHEGLGSVSMWKDFPDRLCAAAACRGLLYSRPGYGRSTPRAPGERWGPDFMHRQALEVLPALLHALSMDRHCDPPWLFGHSDGASIALIHAARFAQQVHGLVLLAPHIMVEAVCLESIEAAGLAYQQGNLKPRLARHHDDPDSAFWGWNQAWLAPQFRHWSIEEDIASITCPLLAVQGVDDEYGSLEQIRGIARRAPQAELLELPACGHAPQRDHPGLLIECVCAFMARHRAHRQSAR
jgi:pimeloyl-ACP methyl ester carboxylesterase